MALDKISEIMESYYDTKRSISERTDDTLASTNQKELQELKINTRTELTGAKSQLINDWEKLTEELQAVTQFIENSTTPQELRIYSEKSKPIKEKISVVRNKIALIDAYLKTEFDMSNEQEIRLKPWEERNRIAANETEEELVDVSKDLRDNAKILEESYTNDMLPFDDDLNYDTPRKILIGDTYEKITDSASQVSLNDSKTKYVTDSEGKVHKLSSNGVELPSGEYVNLSDILDSLKLYISATKNKKFIVLDSKNLSFDSNKLDKVSEMLKQSIKLYIDTKHEVFANTENGYQDLGNVGEAVKPGNYVSKRDVLVGIDDVITPEESTDKVVGKLIKKVREQNKG